MLKPYLTQLCFSSGTYKESYKILSHSPLAPEKWTESMLCILAGPWLTEIEIRLLPQRFLLITKGTLCSQTSILGLGSELPD